MTLVEDGTTHCFDGGESNDESIIHIGDCGMSEFQCRNFQCIPGMYECDGHFQCSDHSDELRCLYVSCFIVFIQLNVNESFF